MTDASRWLSVHLRFDGALSNALYGAACDELLLDVVAPAVAHWTREGWIDGWFFVRYQSADEGPHLRLRLQMPEPAASRSWSIVGGQIHGLASDRRVLLASHVPYEPELRRYGGPTGVRLSEELFVAQSDAAVALLRRSTSADRSSDRPRRLGQAVLAQLVLLHAFDSDRRRAAARSLRFGDATTQLRTQDAERWAERWIAEHRRAFDRQADGLAPYVEHAWSALDDDEPLTPDLDRFRDAVRPIVRALRDACAAGRLEVPDAHGRPSRTTRWGDAADWLLPAHLHMLNNRLGVDLREECYLATVVAATLDPSTLESSTPPPSFEPAGSAGRSTADL